MRGESPLRGAVPVDRVSPQKLQEVVAHAWQHGRGGRIATANLQFLALAARDPAFRQILDQAEVVTADGMPLVWASWLSGRPVPGRLTGTMVLDLLGDLAVRHGRVVALVGGRPGAAAHSAAVLQQRFPGLRVEACCPPQGFEDDPLALQALHDQLRAWAPSVVFLGLGAPKQDVLGHAWRVHHPQVWWVGVGGVFEFLSGQTRRAPQWMQGMGLEWLYRLVQEPRRLARRYLVECFPVVPGLLLRALKERWEKPRQRG